MWTLVTPPAAEPVSLAEAKSHLDVSHDDDDAMITAMATAARQKCESHLSRSFITTAWRLTMDGFPGQYSRFSPADTAGNASYGLGMSGLYGPIPERFLAGTGAPIVPAKARLIAVSSFTYVDATGTTQTLTEGTDYTVEPGDGGRICPAFGRVWPSARVYPGSVTIALTMGYGNAASVPETVKSALKLYLSHLYENRSAVVVGSGVTTGELPMGVKWLLASEDWGVR